jgi:alpha-tubulin suppressor-like RCC1 family protein
MATRFNGGVIGVRNSTTGGASGVARGRFSSNEVLLSVKDNTWPEWQIPLAASLFTWGYNDPADSGYGQGGTNGGPHKSSPVQVGSSIYNSWKTPDASYHHMAVVKENGELWAWGLNTGGAIGQNNTINKSSPVQVGALTNWSKPSTGHVYTICTKTDGTLWAWGANQAGNLGLNLNINISRSSPSQIGSNTDWLNPATARFYRDHTLCTTTDGKLYAWGRNDFGQLGLGDTVDRSSPVQVGSNTNWSKPSCGLHNTYCVTTDGKLYAWGQNQKGQLGLNDAISRSSPVQVGLLTTWLKPAGGYDSFTGTKTDGTLWTWGDSLHGQLGLNDAIQRSSPVQIGVLTTWLNPAKGQDSTFCTRTNGTLWSWGDTIQGLGGRNNAIQVSSPVQIGSESYWEIPFGSSYAIGCTTSL